MPAVGLTNVPLLDRLIFAHDGSDYRVVKCDTNGNLVMALNAGSSIITVNYVWDGTGWKKGIIALGYSGIIAGNLSATSTGGATTTVSSSVVPAAEVWAIELLHVIHTDTVARAVGLIANYNTTDYPLNYIASLAVSTTYLLPMLITLGPGCYLKAGCDALASGKIVYLRYWGRKIVLES